LGSQNQSPAIPEAPAVGRYWQFYPLHLIGVLVLLAIPLMALLGVFGRTKGQVMAAGTDVSVAVTYLERVRYKEADGMSIAVTNMSDEVLDELTVQVGAPYIANFTETDFEPSLDRVTDEYFEIDLTDVQPDETRQVMIALRAEEYGRLDCVVIVQGAAVPVTVSFSTLVFP